VSSGRRLATNCEGSLGGGRHFIDSEGGHKEIGAGRLFKCYEKCALGMVPRTTNKDRLNNKGMIIFGPPVDHTEKFMSRLKGKHVISHVFQCVVHPCLAQTI
jgi:hypothetical protein